MLNLIIGYFALVALFAIIVTVLKKASARRVWVRHCAPTSDIDDIISNGFNRPWCEELLINAHGVDVDLLGQKGEDRVSFSMYKDQPYWDMRKALAEVNNTAKDLTYLYVKVPVAPKDTFLSDAVLVLSNGDTINYGQGVEINIDRDVVNAAIRKGDCQRTPPRNYRSLYQNVLAAGCVMITLYNKAVKKYA